MSSTSPIPYAYWVEPHQLLAGEHPSSTNLVAARETIRRLLEAGVTVFIDLTEAEERQSYMPLVQGEATGQKIDYYRVPIRDYDTPSSEQMSDILALIDSVLAAKRTIYLHCLGGIGRTGTVVGCHFVHHGISGQAALQKLAHLTRSRADGPLESPETDAQRQFVQYWMQEGC
jgi:protein-tyrosine phosphatase